MTEFRGVRTFHPTYCQQPWLFLLLPHADRPPHVLSVWCGLSVADVAYTTPLKLLLMSISGCVHVTREDTREIERTREDTRANLQSQS